MGPLGRAVVVDGYLVDRAHLTNGQRRFILIAPHDNTLTAGLLCGFLGLRLGGSLLGFLLDRKSTRLNSSHSQISYAVFCLKKKKNTTTRSAADRSKTVVVRIRHAMQQ